MIDSSEKCWGSFINDRTCQLCHELDSKQWGSCKRKYEETNNLKKKLYHIMINCPHKKLYSGTYGVYYCELKNSVCKPELNCEQSDQED